MKSPFHSTLKLYVLSELCQLKDDKADSGVISTHTGGRKLGTMIHRLSSQCRLPMHWEITASNTNQFLEKTDNFYCLFLEVCPKDHLNQNQTKYSTRQKWALVGPTPLRGPWWPVFIVNKLPWEDLNANEYLKVWISLFQIIKDFFWFFVLITNTSLSLSCFLLISPKEKEKHFWWCQPVMITHSGIFFHQENIE